MPVFPFYKFSPSGNTTLFLLGNVNTSAGDWCRLAIGPEGICAEQSGMVELDSHTLQMGGGEFCANAARAFGALLAMREDALSPGKTFHFDVKISGSPDPVHLTATGTLPLWHVAATFSIEDTHMEKIDQGAFLARLPGITHILLADTWPELSRISERAKAARLAYLPEDCPASGIVWWRERDGELEILPHVEVPALGTSMLESSCGSASLALALALARTRPEKKFLVHQPHGDLLSITLEGENKATLAGEVRICAKGEIYLTSL